MLNFSVGEWNGVAFHAGGALGVGDDVVEVVGVETGLLKGGDLHVLKGLVEPVEEVVGGGVGFLEDELSGFVVFGEGGVLGCAVGEGGEVGLDGVGEEGGADLAVGGTEEAAEGAGESVDGTETDVGEGNTAEEGSVTHVGARLLMLAVVVGGVEGFG